MKNRMKKITALGLSALMCFSVTACGGGAQETAQSGGLPRRRRAQTAARQRQIQGRQIRVPIAGIR